MIYLLSYPRSGNTWVRYMVEYLTQRPTYYHIEYKEKDPPIGARDSSLNVNLEEEPVMLKRHWFKSNDQLDPDKDSIILLIRNYKEVIPRHHCEAPSEKFPTLASRFSGEMRGSENSECDYIKVIVDYDNWSGKKTFFYYEDLVRNPHSIFTELYKIFKLEDINISLDRYENFKKNMEHHRTNGIKNYHTKSWTKGKVNQLDFHQKQVNPDLLHSVTVKLKKQYPKIFEHYLSCYE